MQVLARNPSWTFPLVSRKWDLHWLTTPLEGQSRKLLGSSASKLGSTRGTANWHCTMRTVISCWRKLLADINTAVTRSRGLTLHCPSPPPPTLIISSAGLFALSGASCAGLQQELRASGLSSQRRWRNDLGRSLGSRAGWFSRVQALMSSMDAGSSGVGPKASRPSLDRTSGWALSFGGSGL